MLLKELFKFFESFVSKKNSFLDFFLLNQNYNYLILKKKILGNLNLSMLEIFQFP